MNLLGSPRPPHSCLDMGTRSATTGAEMEAMRAAAWHRHGIAAIHVADVADPWLRQALTNEANRRWGRRNGGSHHGR